MVSPVNGDIFSTPSSFNYENNLKYLNDKVAFFIKEFGINKQISLKFKNFDFHFSAKLHKSSIELPSWFIFRYDDIPEEFLLTELNDCRFDDNAFIQRFVDWVNVNLLRVDFASHQLVLSYSSAKSFLCLLHNREFYEKARDFILGHEIAHHSHHIALENRYFWVGALEGFVRCSFIAFLVNRFIFSTILVPSAFEAIDKGLEVLSLFFSLAGAILYSFPIAIPTTLEEKREEEKKCDLDAARALQDATGGIYYFKESLFYNCLLRSTSLRNGVDQQDLSIDEEGNDRADTVHPSLTERIAYLSQWQSVQASIGPFN